MLLNSPEVFLRVDVEQLPCIRCFHGAHPAWVVLGHESAAFPFWQPAKLPKESLREKNGGSGYAFEAGAPDAFGLRFGAAKELRDSLPADKRLICLHEGNGLAAAKGIKPQSDCAVARRLVVEKSCNAEVLAQCRHGCMACDHKAFCE